MGTVLQDVRYGLRGLVNAPGISAIVLLTVAIGTGANAAVFSVVNALLFRPAPGVADPSALVAVYSREDRGKPAYGRMSYDEYAGLAARPGAFEALAAARDDVTAGLTGDHAAQNVRVAAVSGTFFTVLGLSPAQGRLLNRDDERPGAAAAAVVRYDLWQGLFNGDPGIVGRTITLDDRSYVVAGVAPPRFEGLQLGRPCDVWIVLPPPASADARQSRELWLVGRLRAGADLGAAQRQLDEAPRSLVASPWSQLDPALRGQVTLIGVIVLGATGLVLLIACANVANLLLSRATARGREMGVRFALGASRGRLIRQLLTESLLMALAGGALGVLFAAWMADILPALFAPGQADMLDTRMDARVFLFTAAISGCAGVLSGLAPAVHTTRQLAGMASRGDASGISDVHGAARVRAALVVLQVALSCVLLVATGLLVRSLQEALRADLGLVARSIAVVSLRMPGGSGESPRSVAYQRHALEQVRKLPGIEATAWIGTLPLAPHSRRLFQIAPEARSSDAAAAGDAVEVDTTIVSPGYFDAMRIPVTAGRRFDQRDRPRSPPVAIVDDELARRYFGATAVGRALIDAEGTPIEIVGVARSGKFRTLQEAPRPTVYYPLSQSDAPDLTLVARTAGDPEAALAAIRQRLQALDADVDIRRATTLESHLSEALASDTLTTTLVGACGLLAALLAMVGVYGVMTDAVMRRTREIGVRVALGARPRHVVRLVFMEGLRLTTIGVALGLAGTAAIVYLLRSRLHVAASVDAATFALLPALLLVLSLLAALVPAYRAIRINPLVVLRDK